MRGYFCRPVWIGILAACLSAAQETPLAAGKRLEQAGRIREALSSYAGAGRTEGADRQLGYEGVLRTGRLLLAANAADDEMEQAFEAAAIWSAGDGDRSLRAVAADSLALVRLRRGRATDALRAYTEASVRVDDLADNANFSFNWARAFQLAGNSGQAFQGYLQALRIVPDLERAAIGAVDTATSTAELVEVSQWLAAAAPGEIALPNIRRALRRTPEPRILLELARSYLRAGIGREKFTATELHDLRSLAGDTPTSVVSQMIDGLITAFTGSISAENPHQDFAAWTASADTRAAMAALLVGVSGEFVDPGRRDSIADQVLLRHEVAWWLDPEDPAIAAQYLRSRSMRPELPIEGQIGVSIRSVVANADTAAEPSNGNGRREDQLRLNMVAAAVATSDAEVLAFRKRAALLEDALFANQAPPRPGVHELLGRAYMKAQDQPNARQALEKARSRYAAAGDSDGTARIDTLLQLLQAGIETVPLPKDLREAMVLWDNQPSTDRIYLALGATAPYLRILLRDSSGTYVWTELPTAGRPAVMAWVDGPLPPGAKAVAVLAGEEDQLAIWIPGMTATQLLRPSAPPNRVQEGTVRRAIAGYRNPNGTVTAFVGFGGGNTRRCVAQYLIQAAAESFDRYEFVRWIESTDGDCDVTELAVDSATGTLFVVQDQRLYQFKAADSGTPVPDGGQPADLPGRLTLAVPATQAPIGSQARIRVVPGAPQMLIALPPGISLGDGQSVWSSTTGGIEGMRLCDPKESAGGFVCLLIRFSDHMELVRIPPRVQQGNACDLNGDGVVNAVDVQIAIDQALGVRPCPNDGLCNVVTVQRIINASIGGPCVTGPLPPTGLQAIPR